MCRAQCDSIKEATQTRIHNNEWNQDSLEFQSYLAILMGAKQWALWDSDSGFLFESSKWGPYTQYTRFFPAVRLCLYSGKWHTNQPCLQRFFPDFFSKTIRTDLAAKIHQKAQMPMTNQKEKWTYLVEQTRKKRTTKQCALFFCTTLAKEPPLRSCNLYLEKVRKW